MTRLQARILLILPVFLLLGVAGWIEITRPMEIGKVEEVGQVDVVGLDSLVASPLASPSVNPFASQSAVLGLEHPADFEEALVSRIIDGDTIELSDGRILRYIGIDTPETKHPKIGQECFGTQASQRNAELVLNQQVGLEKDVSETDRYGRLLRYVWLGEVMVNEQLVAEGFATAITYQPDVKYQDKFLVAQQQARDKKLGMWASCAL